MRNWLFIAVLASLGSVAHPDGIPITHWVGPPGSRPGTYQEWIAEHPIDPASNYAQVVESNLSGDSGCVAVYVDSVLWVTSPELQDVIMYQFQPDLNAEGFGVQIRSVSPKAFPETVQTRLKQDYASLSIKGVLLVGTIQPAWFEDRNDSAGPDPRKQFGYADWPIDLFYSALNGTWYDTLQSAPRGAPNGLYDGFGGDTTMNIYVGRLMPPKQIGDRVQLLLNYFRKDHAYRLGTIRLWPRALYFADDDWHDCGYWADELAVSYPDIEVDTNCWFTTAQNYLDRLRDSRAWVSVFAHGNNQRQEFMTPGGWGGDFYAISYDTCNPPANFYNHYTCSFLRYTDILNTDTLMNGGASIFNDSFGVSAVGSTKTGGMYDCAAFYGPLSEGRTIGEAFRRWFADYVFDRSRGDPQGIPNVCWHYGMTLLGDPFLKPVLLTDVAPVSIVAPIGVIDSGDVVPRAVVKNLGKGAAVSFPLTFEMWRDGVLWYADTKDVSGLCPNSSADISFRPCSCIAGTYQTKVRSVLSGDQNPVNDTVADGVLVQSPLPGWSRETDVPPGPRPKNIKDGGCLAADGFPPNSTENIYALKGNNTCEFYRYDLATNSWYSQESIPVYNQNRRKKTVKKGAALIGGTDGRVYGTKGNNTLAFWCYDPVSPSGQHWTQLTDVPTGAKALKEGTGLAAVSISGTSYIYILKGSSTWEFYRYRISDGSWATMADAPGGNSGKPYKCGSSITYDNNDTIWCLKGSYNELAAYSVSGNNWVSKDTLPRVAPPGHKKTKVKDGAGLACLGRDVYALKGGNTNELWLYECDTRTWLAADSLPRGSKKVRGGGGMVAGDNMLWALRGNNTCEFWMYVPSGAGLPPGQYEANTPGANEVAVATCANATAETPQISHDGTWTVFCLTDQDHVELFKAPTNGGQATQLTSLSGDCSNPVFSPDDSSIGFEYESNTSQYRQIAIVSSGGGQVTVLTSDDCDHENPVFSIGGNGLFYSRPDATTGYDEVYYISSTGGSEQATSSSSYDHEKPQVLSNTEVICERDGDDVYTGIYKLNVSTGQEVELTSGSADYSGCCVAPGARLFAAEKTDQDGYSQIVVFSADGGTETAITSGEYDFCHPTLTNDGAVLSCLRQGSSGSAVCLFDLLEGTCHVLTDALADREAPDVQVVNSAQHLVSTTYTREGDVYKVDYLSSSGLVIAPNGFRAGIARDPNGYVHSVYSDGTLVRHEVRDQTGTCIRRDTPGYGDSPSLSMAIAGDAVVVSRKGDSIFGSVQRSNNSWKRVLLYSAPANHHVGPPGSAAFQVSSGRFIACCVPCYDSTSGASMILFMQADTSGHVVLDTLDLCTGSFADSSVCMAVNSASNAIEVAYVRSESVFYRSLHFSPSDTMRPVLWTGPSRVNDSATTGRNPTCERLNGRLYVAFSEHWIDGSSNPVWSIVRASRCDTVSGVTWEGRTPVSTVDSAHKDFPSLSFTQVAWVESSSAANYWTIRANISDSLLLLSPDTNSMHCALLCDSTCLVRPATQMTRVRTCWLQKYDGDTWVTPVTEREIYAASADPNVTMYNQGRKLCLDSSGSSTDSIRVVFRSKQASLWVASKRDGDETWTSSLLRSTGDMPAIAQSQQGTGRIWCCDRDISTFPPGNVIRCQNRAKGSNTWHDCQIYFTANPNPSLRRLGPPAIAVSLNDTSAGQNREAAYVIFTTYSQTPLKSAVVLIKIDTAGNVLWTDTLHTASNLTDSFADVAIHSVAGQGYGLHATWSGGGAVQYRKTTNLDQPEFTTKRLWSASYTVSSGTNNRHPVVAADAETVLVAFAAGDSGRILTKGQAPGSNYNVWDDTVNVSQCPDTVADWPSIAPLAPGESTVVSYQKRLSSTNCDVMARVNFHSTINLSNSSANSTYPHVAFHFHNDSFPVITAIWTEEQGPTTAEVGYKRWQLGLDGGGGIQDYSIFNPDIRPALYAPAPNPFNHAASIRFSTNIRGLTRVSIMDITGRRVRNLLSTMEKPGVYNLVWNARDDRERRLAGGVYFVRLLTPNYHETRKVIMTQ